jgi:hypothetical protein
MDLDLPRVDPIGLLETPAGEADPGRRAPFWIRAAAAALALLFLVATLLSGAASLGRYCLTTDGGDTRSLPGGYHPPAR